MNTFINLSKDILTHHVLQMSDYAISKYWYFNAFHCLLFFYKVAMLLPHIFEDFGAFGSRPRMRNKEVCNFLAYFGIFGTPNPTSGIRHTAPLIPFVPSFAAVLQPCMSSVSQPHDLRNDFPP